MPSPSEWEMRVGAAHTQTGVLAKRRAKGSAGEIEELGRELELARARSIIFLYLKKIYKYIPRNQHYQPSNESFHQHGRGEPPQKSVRRP